MENWKISVPFRAALQIFIGTQRSTSQRGNGAFLRRLKAHKTGSNFQILNGGNARIGEAAVSIQKIKKMSRKTLLQAREVVTEKN